jgi:phosphoribosylformylglycinamidine cyclo-ligase
MPEERLTYRGAGVDVEANNEANERIKAEVRRTHDRRVLTRPGLFGGAVSLEAALRRLPSPVLVGTLVSGGEGGEGAPGGAPLPPDAGEGARIVAACRARLPAPARPVAFLDYIAAERLEPRRAAALVGAFALELRRRPRVPLIGGETAEMPGVLRRGAWETAGALFAVAPGTGGPGGAAAAGQSQAGGGAGERPAAALGGALGLSRPALVFSMDGVGTKTKLAVMAGRTEGLALDIIHHSLNDILCQGAEGLAFLFYVGCHQRDPALLEPLAGGLARRCRELGLAALELVVAEKPSVYLPGEYDLCAAVAGLLDAGRLIQGEAVEAGDVLLGLGSSGLHTNGYSLARRALLDRGGLRLQQRVPELGGTLGEALLEPHRDYAPALLPLLREPSLGGAIRGIAHITGGGLPDNLARVLPQGLGADVRLGSWPVPPLFPLIQRAGGVPESDPAGKGMYESFNMGIGLVLVAAARQAEGLRQRLEQAGERAYTIGTVARREGAPKVRLLP